MLHILCDECIDLFHITQKYNVIIRIRHFGRQTLFIIIICVVSHSQTAIFSFKLGPEKIGSGTLTIGKAVLAPTTV